MIDKIKDLEVEMIALSHGYILRTDVKQYIDYYDEASRASDTTKEGLILWMECRG